MTITNRRLFLLIALAILACGILLASRVHAQFQPPPFGPNPGFAPGGGPIMGPRPPTINNPNIMNPGGFNPGGMNPNLGGGPRFPSLEKQWVCSGCGASLGNGLRPAGSCGGCGAKIINGSGGPAPGGINPGPGVMNPGMNPLVPNQPIVNPNQPGLTLPAIPPAGFDPIVQQQPAPQAAQNPPQNQQQVEVPNFLIQGPEEAAGHSNVGLLILAGVLSTLLVVAIVALVIAKAAGAF